MKKFILPILLFLMFIPLYVNAETCDTDKITIDNITIENKSNNVEEIEEATANGKNINLNLSMSEVGDSIEYKFIVKNDSNEDYELDKNSFNLSSDYIEYTLDTEDDTNIVKANSSKVVSLKVNYANELPDDAFESGTYNDNKSMTLNLSTGDIINVPDTLKNPNTGVQSYILILFLILLISITAYVILKKKKYAKFMILIIVMVPIGVYALCKCEISIESNIIIKQQSNKICQRAETLHTATCSRTDKYGCRGNNKYENGATITYGNLGTSGALSSGDAFDCDVNNDGVWDPATERFYYVTDEGENAVLIYYTNVSEGVIPTQNTYAYATKESATNLGFTCTKTYGCSNYGPLVAYEQLPSTSDWTNQGLIAPGTRQITSENGTTSTDGEIIERFTYTNKAARLLTAEEVIEACGITIGGLTIGKLEECNYLMENLGLYEGVSGAEAYWLESPQSSNFGRAWEVSGTYRDVSNRNSGISNYEGVRPVIIVLKSNISY